MNKKDREVQLDLIVGQNIRVQRLAAGLSQRALSDELGVTFQQIQKVEQGKNRIGAGRLALAAEVLKCPLDTLFAQTKDCDTMQKSIGIDVLDLSLINRLNAMDPELQRLIRKFINRLSRLKTQSGY